MKKIFLICALLVGHFAQASSDSCPSYFAPRMACFSENFIDIFTNDLSKYGYPGAERELTLWNDTRIILDGEIHPFHSSYFKAEGEYAAYCQDELIILSFVGKMDGVSASARLEIGLSLQPNYYEHLTLKGTGLWLEDPVNGLEWEMTCSPVRD